MVIRYCGFKLFETYRSIGFIHKFIFRFVTIAVYEKTLRSLNLSNNQYITDCSLLEEFENLEVLDLSFDNIKDFSFLLKLKKLRDLRVVQGGLKDLRCLKGLTNLENLMYLKIVWNM